MTINSETHNQLDALQKVIDGYKQRLEQIENDPSLAATGEKLIHIMRKRMAFFNNELFPS